MIARLLQYALRQRFISVLLGLVLIGLGVWAFQQLKVEAYPDISDTQVVVISQYSGRATEEVEQQVTIPIEIRARLGLLPNTEVAFELQGNSARLIKISSRRAGSRGHEAVQRLRGAATVKMTTDEILALTRRGK